MVFSELVENCYVAPVGQGSSCAASEEISVLTFDTEYFDYNNMNIQFDKHNADVY